MPGLEHNFNDAERNLQRDVRNPHDVKPPREIGGGTEQNRAPKEISEKDIPVETTVGGSYQDCKKFSDGKTQDVHHVPAKDVSPLTENVGPCIVMEREDHKQTASYGVSREAREYRAEQKKLIDSGNFRGAFEMDKQDIQSKFGNKYDKALTQAEAYINKLEQGGIVK